MIASHEHSQTPLASSLWLVDASASHLGFAVNKRHLLVRRLRIRGRFSGVTGSIRFDPRNPSDSSAEIAIAAGSVSTAHAGAHGRMAKRESEMRDAHLRRKDFFDVGTYPTLAFRSTGVNVVDVANGEYRVNGELTIKGTTRTVSLAARYDLDEAGVCPRLQISASGSIDRDDFGLTWDSVLIHIGPSVDLELVLCAARASQ